MKPKVSSVGLLLFFGLSACSDAQDAQAVYKTALPSVMTLKVVYKDGSTGTGTGFLAIKESLAVTAWHVVDNAESVVARFSDGQEFDVSGLIDKDEKRDVAIIRVKVADRPMLKLQSAELNVGEPVYLLGAPKSLEFSLSDGIVSQVRVLEGVKEVQYSAPTNPGNSGGPLLNSKSEVIGVVSWKLRSTENLNFASAISNVKGLDDTLPTQPWASVKKSASSQAVVKGTEKEVNMAVKDALANLWKFALRIQLETESIMGTDKASISPLFVEDSINLQVSANRLHSFSLNTFQRSVSGVVDLAITAGKYLEECSRNQSRNGVFDDANANFVASYRFATFSQEVIDQLKSPENQSLRDELGPILTAKIFASENQQGWHPGEMDRTSRKRFEGGYRLLARLALDVDSTGYVFGFVVDPSNPARVFDVQHDTPPGNWGFKKGDVVIEVEGKPVSSIEEMKKGIIALRKDAFVTVIRDGIKRKLKIRSHGILP